MKAVRIVTGTAVPLDRTDVDTDQIFASNGVKVFVDPISVRYLAGAEVDFVDKMSGGGFTVKNPNAKTTFGCGQSFGV